MTTTRRERRGERSGKRRGLIQGLTAVCVRYVERLMPDPYLFAVILTLIVVLLVVLLVRGATASGVTSLTAGSRQLLLTPRGREGPVQPVRCCGQRVRLLERDARIADRRILLG